MITTTETNFDGSEIKDAFGLIAKKQNDFGSFKKINDISRQYLLLMMKMQESPLLLSLFSDLKFNGSDRTVNSTSLTKHFLTEGVVIYSVVSLDGKYDFKKEIPTTKEDEVEAMLQYPLLERGVFGVPVDPMSDYRREILKHMNQEFGTPTDEREIQVGVEYEGKNGKYKVYVVSRESGCGFHIPENSVIRLDPRLVWTQTKLKLNRSSKITDENDGIYIINTAGGVEWFQSDWKTIDEMDNAQFMQKGERVPKPEVLQSDTFQELSNNKTKMYVLDNEIGGVERAVIIMPFICCAFDMLTEVYYNGETEPLILFTT